MDTPALSVVLPCRNAAETVREAVDSIRRQTFEDWELIAVDDGSTDGSGGVLASLASEDRRVRVVETAPRGIVAALQEGCRLARAPLIARMDADDTAKPERFEKQLQLLAGDKRIALCGVHVDISGPAAGEGRVRYRDWLNGLVTHEDIVRELFVECPVAHPAFMMRRADFEGAGGYEDHGWAEDYDLCMRLFLAGKRFANVPERLLVWRDEPGRLSMNDPRYAPERFRALKRHYLLRSYLRGRSVFHQWGAGEVGKRWLREWDQPRPAAVVDINPRKIGRSIHGTPVIAPEALPGPGETFVLVAVGAPGAREEIRDWFAPRGYSETADYLFIS